MLLMVVGRVGEIMNNIEKLIIVIRVDSSVIIGSGHVMRCLTLADELKHRGANVIFICREHTGHLTRLIENKGYKVELLPRTEIEYISSANDVAHAAWLGVPLHQDADDTIMALKRIKPSWLIVDHYAIDNRWETKLRPFVNKIMVIDDLADRPHDCDLLLDQNLYQALETRYDNLVSQSCNKLLGPKYALLRSEFASARKKLRQRDGYVKRLLVFFGGVDPTNETEKTLQALIGNIDHQIEVDVVVGSGNIHKEQIHNLCSAQNGFIFHCQVNNMAELMASADLSIGGGGATTWERCFLGLPSITIVVAENQLEASLAVEKAGAAWNLGWHENVSVKSIMDAIKHALDNPDLLLDMSLKGQRLMGRSDNSDNSTVTKYIMGGIIHG